MAGSWGAIEPRNTTHRFGNAPNMFALSAEFTADASAATVPDLSLSDYDTAFLTDVGVVFDGTTPPDSVTVTIQDADGLGCHPNDTLTFAASGRLPVSDRPSTVGGCSIAISGNSTNSAKARVTVYFAANPR